MEDSKKRVLFVTSSLNLGGAERQLLLLCQNLESYVDLQIISLESEGSLKEKYLKAFPNTLFLTQNKPLKQIQEMIKIIRTSNTDIVITWLYRADLLGGIAAKLAKNIPVVWSARNSSIPDFTLLKKTVLSIFSHLIPSKVVSNGKPAYDFHKEIGYPVNKLLTIPNFLSTWTNDVRSNSKLIIENLPPIELRIGIAARQVSGKGIIETINALHFERDNLPKINLTIIGQESDESRNWNALGEYRGHQVKELTVDVELAEWFQSLDIYLMSSTAWESQPNSLLEAVAIGCPILVADSIEFDFVIPEIFKYNPADSASLANKITFLHKNTSQVKFEIENLSKMFANVYSSETNLGTWKSLIFHDRFKKAH